MSISRSGDRWLLEPDGAAVLIAGTSGCSTADAVCRCIDFFASLTAAEAQLSTDPTLAGFVVDRHGECRIAGIVIGPLLGGEDR